MATACVWLSVVVKSGHRVVRERTAVKSACSDKFQDLYDDHPVVRVEISKDDRFMDPMVVPLDASVSICVHFQCSYVCLFGENLESNSPSPRGSIDINTKNAFDVLMSASCEMGLPSEVKPPPGEEIRKDQLLYNDLLG